ncbi:hypothetical protein HK405_004524 [Cladochytrium tenue]|nr:hypothetical protein HK405_004524 [Cladochytrium tenue]
MLPQDESKLLQRLAEEVELDGVASRSRSPSSRPSSQPRASSDLTTGWIFRDHRAENDVVVVYGPDEDLIMEARRASLLGIRLPDAPNAQALMQREGRRRSSVRGAATSVELDLFFESADVGGHFDAGESQRNEDSEWIYNLGRAINLDEGTARELGPNAEDIESLIRRRLPDLALPELEPPGRPVTPVSTIRARVEAEFRARRQGDNETAARIRRACDAAKTASPATVRVLAEGVPSAVAARLDPTFRRPTVSPPFFQTDRGRRLRAGRGAGAAMDAAATRRARDVLDEMEADMEIADMRSERAAAAGATAAARRLSRLSQQMPPPPARSFTPSALRNRLGADESRSLPRPSLAASPTSPRTPRSPAGFHPLSSVGDLPSLEATVTLPDGSISPGPQNQDAEAGSGGGGDASAAAADSVDHGVEAALAKLARLSERASEFEANFERQLAATQTKLAQMRGQSAASAAAAATASLSAVGGGRRQSVYSGDVAGAGDSVGGATLSSAASAVRQDSSGGGAQMESRRASAREERVRNIISSLLEDVEPSGAPPALPALPQPDAANSVTSPSRALRDRLSSQQRGRGWSGASISLQGSGGGGWGALSRRKTVAAKELGGAGLP